MLQSPAASSNPHTLVALPSSAVDKVADTRTTASDSEDELSEAAESPVTFNERPSVSGALQTAPRAYGSDDSSLHDDDADGSDDADYDAAPQPRPARLSTEPSSSSDDIQGLNRKGASPENDEFMRRNPELYGLRRSVRAQMTFHLIYN